MTEHTTSYYGRQRQASMNRSRRWRDPSTVTSASSAAATPASRLPCIWPKWASDVVVLEGGAHRLRRQRPQRRAARQLL